MRLPVINIKRSCGECTLCCKVLEVRALKKAKDKLCEHANCWGGCSIYQDRPEECRAFECLWLNNSSVPTNFRPDKIHGVLSATSNGQNMVIYEDPTYPGYATKKLMPFIEAFNQLDGGRFTIIVCGEKRTLLAPPEVLERISEITYDKDTGACHVHWRDKESV